MTETTTTTPAPGLTAAGLTAAPSNEEAMTLAAAALADDALSLTRRAQRVAIGRALARLRAVDRQAAEAVVILAQPRGTFPPGFIVGLFAARGCDITGSAGAVDADDIAAVIDAARAGIMIGRAHSS